MRQGPHAKRGRGRGNSGRKPHIPLRHQTFDSNGPDVRVRGNAHQVYEKYLGMARDAHAAGDRIMAENFYQHAEHYYRILNVHNDEQGEGGRPFRSNGGDRYQQPYDEGHGYEEEGAGQFARSGGGPRSEEGAPTASQGERDGTPREERAEESRPEPRFEERRRPEPRREVPAYEEAPREQAARDEGPRDEGPRDEGPREEGRPEAPALAEEPDDAGLRRFGRNRLSLRSRGDGARRNRGPEPAAEAEEQPTGEGVVGS